MGCVRFEESCVRHAWRRRTERFKMVTPLAEFRCMCGGSGEQLTILSRVAVQAASSVCPCANVHAARRHSPAAKFLHSSYSFATPLGSGRAPASGSGSASASVARVLLRSSRRLETAAFIFQIFWRLPALGKGSASRGLFRTCSGGERRAASAAGLARVGPSGCARRSTWELAS